MFVWMTRYTGCCFDGGLLSHVMLITYTSLLMRHRIWFICPLLNGFSELRCGVPASSSTLQAKHDPLIDLRIPLNFELHMQTNITLGSTRKDTNNRSSSLSQDNLRKLIITSLTACSRGYQNLGIGINKTKTKQKNPPNAKTQHNTTSRQSGVGAGSFLLLMPVCARGPLPFYALGI